MYCFSYFIKNEKIQPADKGIKKEIGNPIEDVSKRKLSDTTKYLQGAKIESDENPIIPKPIVSFSPKPIVIDSNQISKKNKDPKKVGINSSVIKEPIDKKENSNLEKTTLKLNEIMICRGIYKRNPIKPGMKFINNVDSLFCYTKISNSGSKQEVKHIWYFENKEMTTVSYNIKTSYNYRSWSKKTIYPNQTGKWRVDVITKSGELLGTRDFTVNSINSTY